MELEQLDQLWRSLRSLSDQLDVLVCLGGELIRSLLGAEAVVFLPVVQDTDVWVAFGKLKQVELRWTVTVLSTSSSYSQLRNVYFPQHSGNIIFLFAGKFVRLPYHLPGTFF